MKKMKNLLSFVLALVMVMAMGMTAMASSGADPDPEPTQKYSITIEESKEGHTYKAYQIFAGDLAQEEEKNILSNIEWGAGVDGAALLTALQGASKEDAEEFYVAPEEGADEVNIFAECESARDVAKALEGRSEAVVKKFAEFAAKNLKTEQGTSKYEAGTEGGEGKYTISDLDPGYYLVKDVDLDTSADEPDAYTSYIIQVLANESIAPKSDIPESQKKVDDINDSTDTEDGVEWKDSADYDIGDSVPFQIIGTLPSNFADYEEYFVTFHDEQEDGLTFTADTVKVYIDTEAGDGSWTPGTTVLDNTGNKYYTVSSPASDGCTFDIVFTDLKGEAWKDLNLTGNSRIRVEYESVLNEDAVIGNPGNKNTSHMEFSNNPHPEGEGKHTDTTVPDTVVVFTFDGHLTKIDGDTEEELAGAEFILEKWVDSAWVASRTVALDAEQTAQFTFEGIDDGYYRLIESKTPAGYNTMDPLYFAVVATHTEDEVGEDSLKLTELKVQELTCKETKNADGTFTYSDFVVGDAKDGFTVTMEPADDNHLLAADIVNEKGVVLPETGGIGTTIFYVAGMVLVIVAGVLLVTKKRMSKEQ